VEPKAGIFMIKYEDGTKDVFGNSSATAARPQQQAQQQQQQQQQATRVAQQQAARNQNPVARETTAAPSEPEYYVAPPLRRAYIGIGVGAAFPSESRLFDTGVQITVNFGYLFTDYVGITASGFLTDFPISVYSDATIGLTGGLIGPLFSLPVTETRRVELDLRPTLGYARAQATVGTSSGTDDEFLFAFGVGGTSRFNLSDRFSLSANLDYIHAKKEGVNLSSVGISVGANYRF
jgi:hypothetical protein